MNESQLIIIITGIPAILAAIGFILGKIKFCNTYCSTCVQDTSVNTQTDIEMPAPPPPRAITPQVIFPK